MFCGVSLLLGDILDDLKELWNIGQSLLLLGIESQNVGVFLVDLDVVNCESPGIRCKSTSFCVRIWPF